VFFLKNLDDLSVLPTRFQSNSQISNSFQYKSLLSPENALLGQNSAPRVNQRIMPCKANSLRLNNSLLFGGNSAGFKNTTILGGSS